MWGREVHLKGLVGVEGQQLVVVSSSCLAFVVDEVQIYDYVDRYGNLTVKSW